MVFLLNLMLATISFSKEINIAPNITLLEVGEKQYIMDSKSYHFVNKDRVDFYKSKPPFIVGKNPGLLKYQVGNIKKEVLILNPEQKDFFNKTSRYVKLSPHLDFASENDKLIIKGKAFDLKEIYFLLKNCSHTENIQLKLNPQRIKKVTKALKKKYEINTFIKDKILFSKDSHHKLHTCLSSNTFSNKEYHSHIVLVEDELLNSLSHGLGAENTLDWVFEDKLRISNFTGSASHQKIKTKLKQSLNFKSPLSIDSPLSFSDGTEVQVQDQQGIFTSRNSWKKAITKLEINLIKAKTPEFLIKIDLKQSLRTGESGVFKTNYYSKENRVFLNRWKKVFNFNKESKDLTKNKFINTYILGKKSRSKAKSSYSLWVKIGDHE